MVQKVVENKEKKVVKKDEKVVAISEKVSDNKKVDNVNVKTEIKQTNQNKGNEDGKMNNQKLGTKEEVKVVVAGKSVEEVKDNKKVENATVTTPKVDAPKVDEPKADTPKVDEKSTDEKSVTGSKPTGGKQKGEKKKRKFQHETKIRKRTMNKSLKFLNRMARDGKLDFEMAVQRNTVWGKEQKSLLIHSVLYGFPIPSVFAVVDEETDVWQFLDGKQRMTTLLDYINGKFPLHKTTPDIYGEKIAGMHFKDLDEDLQELILEEQVQITELTKMEKEEVEQMFLRLNNGTQLSKIEIVRAVNTDLVPEIKEIAESSLFAEFSNISNSAKIRFVDQETVLQIAYWLTYRTNIKGFNSANIREFVEIIKDTTGTFNKDLLKQLKDLSSYIGKAVEENISNVDFKKQLKKTHLPMIFEAGRMAKENGISIHEFANFLNNFFITKYDSLEEYKEASRSSVSKKDNVLTRFETIRSEFVAYCEEVLKNQIDSNKGVKQILV